MAHWHTTQLLKFLTYTQNDVWFVKLLHVSYKAIVTPYVCCDQCMVFMVCLQTNHSHWLPGNILILGTLAWYDVWEGADTAKSVLALNFIQLNGVMDIGISILIYITYVYLYCLQLLLVILYSAFIGLDCFRIIEKLLEPLLCTGRLRIFLLYSQKSSYRPLSPLLYYFLF